MPADHELPSEVQDELDQSEEAQGERLALISAALVTKRQAAIAARASSGIEQVWTAAEDAYLGIDAVNRGAASEGRWIKPSNLQGPITTERGPKGETKSTAYVRLTSRYVDAGAAKLGEILLPIGEKAFSFTSTPVPELIRSKGDATPAIHDGRPLERTIPPAVPGAPVVPGAPAPGTVVPITVGDIAQEAIDAAQASAKKAELRIYDWMVESQFPAQMRKVIFDAARAGVGVLKGPYPEKRVSRAVVKATADQKKKVKTLRKIVPAYTWVDFWNIYPSDDCGEDIRSGEYLFEYDQFSRKQVRELKGNKGYNAAALDKVLKEGPEGGESQVANRPGTENKPKSKHRFGVWYFHGTLSREDMLVCGMDPEIETGKEVYAICTMINDTIVRATLNPLDSGEYPYHSVPWQRRAGHWAGVGVGEQLAMPQAAINAATRALFNNAGKSAGSVIVADRGAIVPADGVWEITPDKLFYKAPDATSDDVRKAFQLFQVPNQTNNLMAIIEYCLRLAEECTNIPLVTQGQSGPTTPETYGATQLQENNANQLLRSIGYAYDDHITESVVRQSYEMLLLDDTVPDDEKSDWKIDAHGSISLIERAIQDQTIMQMGQFAINPAFGVNPKKWFAAFSKTKRLNPKDFQYSPEEQAKIDAQPKPQAPAVEVAKIKSGDANLDRQADQALAQMTAQLNKAIADAANETKTVIAGMKKEVDELRVRRDTDRDTIYVQAETERTRTQAQAHREDLELRERLAILDYANKNQMKLADVKKELAKTEMTLRVQKELAGVATEADMIKHTTPKPVAKPAAEPVGKAPAGEAFTA